MRRRGEVRVDFRVGDSMREGFGRIDAGGAPGRGLRLASAETLSSRIDGRARARQAGTGSPSADAIRSTTATATTRVAGRRRRAHDRDARRRSERSRPARPRATSRPCRITSPTTAPGARRAPPGSRSPRVRRATEYAITPYSPIAASSIATRPTPLTSHALARIGNSVASTSASIVWFSTKTRFGSSASSSRRMSRSSAPRRRACGR